jgi:hypothetical protein
MPNVDLDLQRLSNPSVDSRSTQSLRDIDTDQCQNNIVLLHAVVAQINRTLNEALNQVVKLEPEEKIRIKKAYRELQAHHTYNSIASISSVATGAAQIGVAAYYDANTAKVFGGISKAATGSYKEFNQGRIQSADSYLIEVAKKEADQTQENSKRIENLKDRSQETANAAINRVVEGYQIRG